LPKAIILFFENDTISKGSAEVTRVQTSK